DFGLAQQRGESNRLTAENYLVGTPMYMSPEQASGDIPLDHRTDLFSLGSVMYRMATGALPFKGKTTLNVLTALATERPRAPRKLNRQVPRSLSGLIMLLLQKRPDDRPWSARVVLAALTEIRDAPPEEEVVEDVTVEEDEEVVELEPEPEPPPRPPTSRTVRRRRPGPRGRETDEERLERRGGQFGPLPGGLRFPPLSFPLAPTI